MNVSARIRQKALDKGFLTIIIVSLLVTSGCGWHLRGQIDLPADQRDIYLSISGSARAIEKDLRREFTLNGINLVDQSQANLLVSVIKLSQDRRVSSLGTDAVADSVSLSLLVTYSVTRQDGKIIIPLGPARVGKSYTYDRNSVAAKAREEQTIREEIQQELAQQILRSIRYALSRHLESEAAQQEPATTNKQ